MSLTRKDEHAKGIIYLETTPVSPELEAEYHQWYNDTHLEEICSVEGITGARRFAPTDGTGPFIAIYELDCDDLDAVVDRLRELGASGKMSSLQVPQPGRAAHPEGLPRDRVVREVTADSHFPTRISRSDSMR